jgi:opacity protein-like surface antigen
MRLPALILAAAFLAASPAAAADWDATWAGGFEDGGDGVQLIVADESVVGFFFGGDYIDLSDAGTLADDGSLTFKWDGGEATLAAAGAGQTLTIRQPGKPDRVVEMKRDQ